MALEYDFIYRVLTRAAEVAAEPGMNICVINAYDGLLKGPSQAFCKAHEDVIDAMSSYGRDTRDAVEAFDVLDMHYKLARTMVLAFVPGTVLPDTLRSLTTDTDKLNAIKSILGALNKHVGEKWADDILAGDFGVQGPKAAKDLTDAIASNMALANARDSRAEAYGPAYEKLLLFRRVVRDALGARSKQYKRLQLKQRKKAADEEQGAAPPVEGATGAGSAPTLPATGSPTLPTTGSPTLPATGSPTLPAKPALEVGQPA
jgi:hypothetical protein